MIKEFNELFNNYIKWIRDETSLKEINNWVEITTPFLDRHNDHLQIYVKKNDGKILLTDDGYTIDDLELSGFKINSEKKEKILNSILRGFGVELFGNSLRIYAGVSDFPQRKHNLIQAMLALNDMFYLNNFSKNSLFQEDIINWLDKYDIRYTRNYRIIGKSKLDHNFDFIIPKSISQPERFLQAFNNPTRENTEAFVFAWMDTGDIRSANSKGYVILNDRENKIQSRIIDVYNEYSIFPILWSNRDDFKQELIS